MHNSFEHVVNFANAQQHELPESGLLFFAFVGVIYCKDAKELLAVCSYLI